METCNCKTTASSFFSGSYEEGFSLLSAFSITCLIDHDAERIYQCSVCGTVWETRFLPGGGIYGDIEWINISLPHWEDHWFWKKENRKN